MLEDCSDLVVDVCVPNAVVDAVNRASAAAARRRGRLLVLPFRAAPFESDSAAAAEAYDASTVLGMDAGTALLGVLTLPSGPYLLLATEVKRAGTVPVWTGAGEDGVRPPHNTPVAGAAVYVVSRVRFVKLHGGSAVRADRDVSAAAVKMLESGFLFFSFEADLVRTQQKQLSGSRGNAFWWNKPLVMPLGASACTWAVRAVMGYVGTIELPIYRHREATTTSTSTSTTAATMEETADAPVQTVYVTVVSRKSRRRAGTRYNSRGVDQCGHVANFVETEQLVYTPHHLSAFVSVRGSIPVFWKQTKGALRPAPELDGSMMLSEQAFSQHFKALSRSYGKCTAVSLVNLDGSEAPLALAYARHVDMARTRSTGQPPLWAPRFVEFDFHHHCSGREYDRGLCALMSRLLNDLDAYGVLVDERQLQSGVFRVNCVDCLDRTGVVQSTLAKQALQRQLAYALGLAATEAEAPTVSADADATSAVQWTPAVQLSPDSEVSFMRLWGSNADALAYQYAGTGAMKSDMTRTGKRSTRGLLHDGFKSAVRIFNKHFVDDDRQEAYDLLLGYASAASTGAEVSAAAADVPWTSFDTAQMIAGDGERVHVVIHLKSAELAVRTAEHLEYDYRRDSLVQYEKESSRRIKHRLRLFFSGAHQPSPLDLQFHAAAARELFLRTLITWSGSYALAIPPSLLPHAPAGAFRVQVRVASVGQSIWPATAADWGLPQSSKNLPTVVALVLPDSGPAGRRFGLAALPRDLDADGLYRCVAARALPQGGAAMAVLVRIDAADAVAEVRESSVAAENSLSGLVAVSLRMYGTALCFCGGALQGANELLAAMQSARVGRPELDPILQWDHWYAAGVLGHLTAVPLLAAFPGAPNDDHRAAAPPPPPYGATCEWVATAGQRSVLRWSAPGRARVNNNAADAIGRVEARDIAVLVDEYVHALRRGPQIPQQPVAAAVHLENLRVSRLQLPPPAAHLASDIPLQFYVAFAHDLLVEALATPPSHPMPDRRPRWPGRLTLPFLPSDVAELEDAVVHGQLFYVEPLGEDGLCGSFVFRLPMEAAARPFELPLLRGGNVVGRVLGVMRLEGRRVESLPSSSSSSSSMPGMTRSPAHARAAVGAVDDAVPADSSAGMPGAWPDASGSAARRSGKRRVKKLVGSIADWVRGERRESTATFGGPRYGTGGYTSSAGARSGMVVEEPLGLTHQLQNTHLQAGAGDRERAAWRTETGTAFGPDAVPINEEDEATASSAADGAVETGWATFDDSPVAPRVRPADGADAERRTASRAKAPATSDDLIRF